MSKKDIYQMVTDKILAALEQGIIPWERPWSGLQEGAFNRFTKRPYSLINQCLLEKPGEWATFKQWESIGGKVRKGEKSSFVVFWKPLPIKEKNKDGEEVERIIPFLRYYNVFHISQVDGIEPLEKLPENNFAWDVTADDVLNGYVQRENIMLVYEVGNRAYYSPSNDEIHLPLREQFKSVEGFYSTAFHESIHSTMAAQRCNRVEDRKGKSVNFGSEEYSKEELVAEIGSSFIMHKLGLVTSKEDRNTIAYIQSWIQVLKRDSKMIVWASSRAEKAAKFIFNETNEEVSEDVA